MYRKTVRLEDTNYENIQQIMQEKNITSANSAINYIISDYFRTCNELESYDERTNKALRPIIANLRKLEREIHTIKDVVNTTLFEFHDATHLLPADDEEGSYKHRILRESEERYDQNIAMLRKPKIKENANNKDDE